MTDKQYMATERGQACIAAAAVLADMADSSLASRWCCVRLLTLLSDAG